MLGRILEVCYNMFMNMEKLNEVADLSRFGIPESVLMMGVGILLLFVGYRVKKLAFFIIWFLLGFNLVGFLMPNINQMVPEIAASGLYQTLIPIAGGLLLALLGFSIEKLCLGGICFALVMVITVRYFGSEMSALAVGGIIGVIAAGVAVMMMKPATILATAVAGSYAITMALLSINPSMDYGVFYWPILLGLAAVGALVQFVTTKHVS